VVETARGYGCRRLTLHVDGVEQSGDRLTVVVEGLRRSCARGGASLQVVPGQAWLTATASSTSSSIDQSEAIAPVGGPQRRPARRRRSGVAAGRGLEAIGPAGVLPGRGRTTEPHG
jgi:hypothetical protein